MTALPKWVEDTLAKHNIHVVRYGRSKTGRPTDLERKWFFCGWYYHKESRKRVTDGPYGPFPCFSAAMVDALNRYRFNDINE